MDGTQYVIEQLGQALEASHEVIAQQAEEIRQLRASLAETTAQEKG